MSAAAGRRVVLTYGTFDLFHEGHKRLLERARELGDTLIVGVTTEAYDDARGKLNVQQSLMDRVKNVEASGLADQVIIEEYDGQKITDIQKYGVDTFAIGSDWLGKFDYLRDYCEVVYLERTKGVSSTQRRAEESGVLKIGVIGTGRIAARFVAEARYVSGLDIVGAWSRQSDNVDAFVAKHELLYAAPSVEALVEAVDAVYVATPHPSHDEYVALALEHGKHVLCEKPVSLSAEAAQRLFDQAEAQGVVLLEAIKTAFCPGFERLVALARSGVIGEVRSVDAAFSKLADPAGREFDPAQGGGSITELASYPLLAIAKLLGTDHRDVSATVWKPEGDGVDLFGTVEVLFPKAVATARVGLGVKVEGHLVVGGTQGTLYAPAPWWLTTHFDVRYEDPRRNKSFYHPFEGDGLRYEIAEFVSLIRRGKTSSYKLRPAESVWIASVIESARASARTFG